MFRNGRHFFRDPKKVLLGIILLGLALRLVTAVVFFGNNIQALPGVYDEVSYHNLALRLLSGYGFSFGRQWWPGTAANEPTAHWSYLYTLYLAAVYTLFGPNPLIARIIQIVIAGIALPWLLYRLSWRVFAPDGVTMGMFGTEGGLRREQKIGLAAAAVGAVYIYLFYYSAALITESFYICGILWTFDLTIRIARTPETKLRHWLLLGLAIGVTVLLRQLFMLFLPFLLAWLWWAKRPKPSHLLIPLAVLAAMMLPWTARNYLAFGKIVPLNTNSGFAFYWGNHPRYGARFIPILPSEEYIKMIPRDLRAQGLNEAEMDSALLKEAVRIILADPGRYVLLSASRIPTYFTFWPSPDSGMASNLSRLFSFALFLPAMVYGLVLSLAAPYRSRRERLASPLTLLYLFMLAYTAVHLLTWTLIRYRVPVDAVLIIFAGLGIVDVVARLQKRRRLVTAVSR